jgi:hypothetical protein
MMQVRVDVGVSTAGSSLDLFFMITYLHEDVIFIP